MKWIKKGLIYKPGKEYQWMQDRAIAPVCELTDDGLLRIYFSVRDLRGRSTPVYLECNPERPEEIYSFAPAPILEFGALGTFDDNGILSSSVVVDGDRRLLYYVGWNPRDARIGASYHLSIGLAVSTQDGPYIKHSQGPLLDRGADEPFFNTAPCVLKIGDEWKMWYVSGTGWLKVDDYPEPLYNVKHAVSKDGINWTRLGVAVEANHAEQAIGKPFVFIEDGVYKMFYSYRNSRGYRTDKENSYRLGYAESSDGINWIRKDEEMGIDFSDDGWDSIMMEYTSSYVHNGKRFLLYNGNGFGESGFGYAILEQE
jgi:hypothetical protein